MWFIVAGLVISAFGWGFLIWGVAVEASSSLFARPDSTAHTIAIVTNLIYLGYGLCIFGAIWELPKRLIKSTVDSPVAEKPRPDPQTVADQTAVEQPAAAQVAAPAVRQPAQQAAAPNNEWAHVEAEFQKNFAVKARVHPNGRVTLLRGANKLDFENIDRAWDYCVKHFYGSHAGGNR